MSPQMVDLQNAANDAKKKIDESETSEAPIVNSVDAPNDTEVVEENPIIIGAPSEETSVDIPTVADSSITDEDLKSVMPDLNPATFASASKNMRASLSAYKKRLIINNGFTPEEAEEAVVNKMKKDGTEINNKYLEDNPKVGVVEVNKADVDKLEFSQDEKDKISRAKAIKLVVIENKDLESLKIKKIDKKEKATYLKQIEGSLSKYSVPLPILGDFVTFKGAQIIQLISTTKYDDDHIEDLIAKKASLIYDRMYGGTIFNKYDENGKVDMTYSDFANNFKFHDISLATYAILVASSMEETESTLSCSACNTTFQWKYNLKNLLKMDNISDNFKEITDTILGSRNDETVLRGIHDKNYEVTRFKSPFTNNIYDVSYPSIARVMKLFGAIDQKDETMTYLSAIGIFLDAIYIFDKASGEYIPIDSDEVKTMMETIQTIAQSDIDLLFNQIKGMIYEPEFVLESKCPNCGEKMINHLSVDDLIFLSAQDTGMEIR